MSFLTSHCPVWCRSGARSPDGRHLCSGPTHGGSNMEGFGTEIRRMLVFWMPWSLLTMYNAVKYKIKQMFIICFTPSLRSVSPWFTKLDNYVVVSLSKLAIFFTCFYVLVNLTNIKIETYQTWFSKGTGNNRILDTHTAYCTCCTEWIM